MAFNSTLLHRRFWSAISGVLVAWVVVSLWMAPQLIRMAYQGTGPAMLNRLIEGQSVHPVMFYLSAWYRVAGYLSVAVVIGLGIVVLARGHGVGWAMLRETFTPRFPEVSRRDVLVQSLFFGLVGGAIEASGMVYRFALRHVPTGEIAWGEIFWMTPLAASTVLVLLSVLMLAGHRLLTRSPKQLGLIIGVTAFLATFGTLRSFGGALHPVAVMALSLAVVATLMRVFRRYPGGGRRVVRRTVIVGITLCTTWAMAIPLWRSVQGHRALARLPSAAPGVPNILLIVWDTARALNLSAYGYSRETTPELEQLASRGVLFERAIATAPWTLPSHASMFTGREHHELSVDWRTPLDTTFPMLAEQLSALGYVTAGFVANTGYGSRTFGLNRGFTYYDDRVPPSVMELTNSWWLSRTSWWLVLREAFGDHRIHRKRAEDVNRAMLTWLDGKGSRPFFAFLNLMDAHDPYRPPPPFDTLFARPGDQYWVDHYAVYEPAIYQALERAYDGGIAYMDHELGVLLAELNRRGVLDNTLVIVTADHGEAFGENTADLALHGRSLYRSLLHVPLVIAFPSQHDQGVRVPQVVSLRSLPATIMDMIGVDSSPFPGPSLRAFLEDDSTAQSAQATVLSHVTRVEDWDRYPSWPASEGPMFSLVDGAQRHYILDGKGIEHLYDLTEDPWELNDLGVGANRPAIVDRFRAILDSLVRTGGPRVSFRPGVGAVGQRASGKNP